MMDLVYRKLIGDKKMTENSILNFLCEYIPKQLNNFFPDGADLELNDWKKVVGSALLRLKKSFSHIKTSHYAGSFEETFNYLHADHYAMFLYLLSNEIFKSLDNEKMATKIFTLNKALHGIDAYYAIELPEVFLFVHPLGTVLGNANYGNFFAVYQGCTVGSKVGEYNYPKFGENITLYSNTSIIGNCEIGNNVVFAANSSVISMNVKANNLVFGSYPQNKLKPELLANTSSLFNF